MIITDPITKTIHTKQPNAIIIDHPSQPPHDWHHHPKHSAAVQRERSRGGGLDRQLRDLEWTESWCQLSLSKVNHFHPTISGLGNLPRRKEGKKEKKKKTIHQSLGSPSRINNNYQSTHRDVCTYSTYNTLVVDPLMWSVSNRESSPREDVCPNDHQANLRTLSVVLVTWCHSQLSSPPHSDLFFSLSLVFLSVCLSRRLLRMYSVHFYVVRIFIFHRVHPYNS